mgnify:CR=1 FL=1
MFKFRWSMNLQLFSEELGSVETGVEEAPAAEEQVSNEASEPGAETQVAAEPEKQNNFEKAFAKRLADAQAKWESEQAEKYRDYEDYKRAAEYLQKTSGISDLMTLREQIEMAELQERADKENVPPEVLKRLDELEAKAAKAEQLEAEQKQQQEWQQFESSLKQFCEGKEIDGKSVDHMDLWKFMHENGVTKPEVAFKAMKADILEAKLEHAEKEGVKKFLAAKGSIPTITGSTSQGTVASKPPKTFAEARQRAMQRMTGEG